MTRTTEVTTLEERAQIRNRRDHACAGKTDDDLTTRLLDDIVERDAQIAALEKEVALWKPKTCHYCGCQIGQGNCCRNCSGIEHGDG